MDITQIIAEQHDQQRTMFAQLEQFPADDHTGLGALWQRLAIFLETHAEAEERYFYPHLLKQGEGAADADSVDEEVEDAIGDHNNIRDAVRRAEAEQVGSEAWWQAVSDANVANSTHMAEEERQDLTDFRRNASLQQRHDIAVQFLRYEALRAADGIEAADKDPEEYVEAPEKTMREAEAKDN
ncbi:cation-binding protein [Enemella evansiae]|uniref:Cation-binding protein n=1 Tax=Enemella evansiae TaxID=2016499 RepID=A0A255FXE6_9ACTN|nr:hemerythrin domain-containing protein [Enemella evansiae]OYN93398.1 cation-binding protein [Enemella evansiae]OYN97388.1 cation-binding protein [Enemella evansiae]OYO07962.1 cation-binding protein [Enemella evansiae]OYO14915.1 cation-binding protein [Enemella evansiae]